MVAEYTDLLPTNKCHQKAHADRQEMSTATSWPTEWIPCVQQHTLHALLCPTLIFPLFHVLWIFQGPQDIKGFHKKDHTSDHSLTDCIFFHICSGCSTWLEVFGVLFVCFNRIWYIWLFLACQVEMVEPSNSAEPRLDLLEKEIQ